jgi:hypothetical protein
MTMSKAEIVMNTKFPTGGPSYQPWYKAASNTHVRTDDMFDVDRQGNGFIVTVYEYLNKKKETCREVIRVKHMGKVTIIDLADYYGCKRVHLRALDSGDLVSTYRRLCREAPPSRTYGLDSRGYAIKGTGPLLDSPDLKPVFVDGVVLVDSSLEQIRFKAITAVMPRHDPSRVMIGCCDGIHPIRTMAVS